MSGCFFLVFFFLNAVFVSENDFTFDSISPHTYRGSGGGGVDTKESAKFFH